MAETRKRKETPSTAPIAAPSETRPPEQAPPPEPKASVIFIVRNQSAALRRALQALYETPTTEIETFIVDRASDTRNSENDPRAVAADFPQATFLYLPDDFGATKAMNIAARSTKSSALFFLSPDVEISAQTVLSLAENLETHAGDTAAACPLMINENGASVGQAQPLPSRDTLARACAGETPQYETVNTTAESASIAYMDRRALMVRKQFIQGMNFFDERFGEHWADADLALKIRRAQRKIRLYPELKAIWHDPGPVKSDALDRADRILGAAVLLSKYDGAMSGITFRLARGFNALVHANFRLVGDLVSGNRVGSHAK